MSSTATTHEAASPAARNATLETLSNSELRQQFLGELKDLEKTCGTLSREQVVVLLGQWFHPLHYFPEFLSRLISLSPELATKTCISKILWQELGEGNSKRAHEQLFIADMVSGGFTEEKVAQASPLPATRRLVDAYREASHDFIKGLGFLYGTEVVDLPMVATVGKLMRRCTGKQNLEWVNVHVKQEPDHVESSQESLNTPLTESEQKQVIASAENLWQLWGDFFKSFRTEIFN